MSDILDTDKILEDNKNASQIVCVRCTSKILPPQMGKYEVYFHSLGQNDFVISSRKYHMSLRVSAKTKRVKRKW